MLCLDHLPGMQFDRYCVRFGTGGLYTNVRESRKEMLETELKPVTDLKPKVNGRCGASISHEMYIKTFGLSWQDVIREFGKNPKQLGLAARHVPGKGQRHTWYAVSPGTEHLEKMDEWKLKYPRVKIATGWESCVDIHGRMATMLFHGQDQEIMDEVLSGFMQKATCLDDDPDPNADSTETARTGSIGPISLTSHIPTFASLVSASEKSSAAISSKGIGNRRKETSNR